jgi:hypothetical protein
LNFLVEYIGVVLDDKLLWNAQIKRVKNRTIKALMACRGLTSLRWALRPAMLRLICTMVVMAYVSIVLGHKAEKASMSSNYWSHENRSYYSIRSYAGLTSSTSLG